MDHFWIPICVTLLGALVATVWKASAILTDVTKSLQEIRASIVKLEAAIAMIARVPLIEQRVAQLEELVRSLTQGLGSQATKIADLWAKVFSLDKHLAVQVAESRASRPDIDPANPGG